MSLFKRTVDDVVENIVEAVKDLEEIAQERAEEVIALQAQLVDAENELERAERVKEKLSQLVS